MRVLVFLFEVLLVNMSVFVYLSAVPVFVLVLNMLVVV
jgi:hypothetical protein